MTSGRRRIRLDTSEPRPGLLRRLLGRRAPMPEPVEEPAASPVDFTLQHRAELRAVRAFIEAIDTYQLHTRRCVHVVSRYLIPHDRGMEECIPEWLARRVRFGVVPAAGDLSYLGIRFVDVAWDDEGCELFLHLEDKVTPGTRAFIAAYLGDEPDEAPAPPSPVLLGEP